MKTCEGWCGHASNLGCAMVPTPVTLASITMEIGETLLINSEKQNDGVASPVGWRFLVWLLTCREVQMYYEARVKVQGVIPNNVPLFELYDKVRWISRS